MTEAHYAPGVCNINSQEIAQRRKTGYVGLVGFILLLSILLALPITPLVRILVFAPAYVAAIGFLQAHARFCVGYAAAGLEHADEGNAGAKKVTDEAAAKDRRRARTMNAQAFGIALIATVIAVLMPSV